LKKNWSYLATISEIGAAIVVIISLLFIYQELQQNTLSTQDASYQQFLSNLTELDLVEAGDPELTRITLRAESDASVLSNLDWARFTRIASARIAQWEYAYISKINGTMSDVHWESVRPHMQFMLCQSGYQKFLNDGGTEIYAVTFIGFLEEEIFPQCD
jgi:hypothetical protein